MATVYITNANLNLISKTLRDKNISKNRERLIAEIVSDLSIGSTIIEKILLKTFNTLELKNIYFLKMIYKDLESLLAEIKNSKDIVLNYIETQNRKYAFQIKAPSYHADRACEWMNSSFFNIEIPATCKDDAAKKAQIIQWLNEHKHLSFTELNNNFKNIFDCNKDLIQVARKNSGNSDFDNKTIKIDFEEKVTVMYKQLEFDFEGEHHEKIKQYKFAPFYKLEDILQCDNDKNAHDNIRFFHERKHEIEELLNATHRELYNTNLSFDSNLLESIGFRECKGCAK
jgi:hypothetical protein